MSRHKLEKPGQRRDLTRRVVVATVVLGALVVWQWNPALTWFNDRAASQRTTEFARMTASTPSDEQDAQFAAAQEYNAWLAAGGASEIGHAIHEFGAADETALLYRDYEKLLSLDGTSLMADLTVDSIDARLPVVHGTSPTSLDVSAGHLYGTSLPVGGPSTHAVIGAHSGWSKATLFNRLAKVEVGDVFTISVMGRQLAYKVTDITPVKATDSTDLIRIEEGKDLVTLTTCYPTYVNTHRLLVRGERTTDPAPDTDDTVTYQTADPGFPWWAATTGGGATGVMALAFWPTRRKPTPSTTEGTCDEAPRNLARRARRGLRALARGTRRRLGRVDRPVEAVQPHGPQVPGRRR
ncbi:class C sortase [Xylanimonas protaetiae]|uniref:Class C sortase n=1 Tax=Xylanimonas protaetiae TaxID=2509457 RepID=A0A4P6FBU2_9MICO|nr:class C sortase [Xylanimonas protaetiae]